MDIQILGAHNLETRVTRMVSLLIDGVIALDAGSLSSSLSLAEQESIKAILLSHRHYDHVRDVPAIAINTAQSSFIDVYGSESVLDVMRVHLMNGVLYPKFHELPSKEAPALRLHIMEEGKPFEILGYHIAPVPVAHSAPAFGFGITSPDGKRLFYTGDTGRGLSAAWEQISPDLLVTEVTLPNRLEAEAVRFAHLTPRLLEAELKIFQQVNGYLPRVLLVHMNPSHEAEMVLETRHIAQELKADIFLAYEGMKVRM